MSAEVTYRVRGSRRRYAVTIEQLGLQSVGYGRETAEAVAALHPWRPRVVDIVIEKVRWVPTTPTKR